MIKITLKGEQKTIPELTDKEMELILEVCKNQHFISKDDKLLDILNELKAEKNRREIGIITATDILKLTSKRSYYVNR